MAKCCRLPVAYGRFIAAEKIDLRYIRCQFGRWCEMRDFDFVGGSKRWVLVAL